MQRFQHLSDTSYSYDTRIITLADVRTIQYQGTLQFRLPDNPSQVLTAKVAPVASEPDVAFEWTGNIISGGHGYVMFTIEGNDKSGIISVDGNLYEIVPLSGNYQALIKRKTPKHETCGLGVPANITTDPDPDPPVQECTPTDNDEDCQAVVEILIVVEPEAAADIIASSGSLNTFLHSSDNIINLAFANSDIPNKTVHTQWVLDEQIDFLLNNLDDDMLNIAEYFIGEQYREQYGADIVVLLTTDRYTPSYGRVLAIGPDSDAAFGIVEYPAFYSGMVFGHEIGHLFGARHEWGADPTEVCAHGRFYSETFPPVLPGQPYTGFAWRTIVTSITDDAELFADINNVLYPLANLGPIPYYSNPDVYYGAGSTGRTDMNNAEQIRNSGCEIANFNPSSTIRMGMYSTSGCDRTTIKAKVITPTGNLGQPPYAYTWHWSLNGIFDQPTLTANYLGVTSNSQIEIIPPDCKFFYIRCQVSALDGTTVTQILPVDLTDLACPCVEFVSNAGEAKNAANGSFALSPNPSGGNIILSGSLSNGSPVEYTITNVSGQVMLRGITTQGQNIPTETFESGVYFLNITTENTTQSLKFIKQ